MDFTTLFIDKGGIKKDIPGLSNKFSTSELSFWGEYSLLDFALFNINPVNSILICEKEFRKSINSLFIKWEDKNCSFFSYNCDFDTAEDFIKKINDNIIIIYDINFAAVINNAEIQKAVNQFHEKNTDSVVKISVNSTPVDIYIADKDNLIHQFDSMKNRIEADQNIFDFILDEILSTGFNEIHDLDGEILFNSSVDQIFKNNISLIKREPSIIMESFMKNTPAPQERESFISAKANVVNSIISSNSRIEGFVENSVIFSGVIVKQNAVVKNSVVMNGNQIGKNAVIENSVILPNYRQNGNISNIQDKCEIGGKSSRVKNREYPDQIYDGLTVIGMNSSIPAKFIAEPGSLIGADSTTARLKELKKIKKSGSFQ